MDTLAKSILSKAYDEQERLRALNAELVEALEKIVIDEERRAKDLRHRKAWLPLKFSEARMKAARAVMKKATEK